MAKTSKSPRAVLLAALAVVGATVEVSALATLDHRDHRFHLRSAAISRAIEPDLHETAVTAGRLLVGGATMLGGNDGPYAVLVVRKAVVGFGIVAGVGRQLRQAYDPQRPGQQRTELVDVGPRPPAHTASEDEMVVDVPFGVPNGG